MAWTAKLIRASRSAGKWDVVIRYTDGVEVITEGYSLQRAGPKAIKAIARREVVRLSGAKVDVISLPDNTNIDLTAPAEPPPKTPTAAQLAKRKWFRDWSKLQNLQVLSADGVILKTDPRIAALKTSLKADWLNAYLADM